MAKTYFSPTYQTARQLFVESAERAGGRIENYRHPFAKGHAGEDLYIDAAWFGPQDADTIVLSLSGTHGPEGFAGSAVQSAWLETGGSKSLRPGTAALLVHAVNPFGFSHITRSNENLVDLNRNWIDFTKPLPTNPNYDLIHSAIPTSLEAFSETKSISDWGDNLVNIFSSWELSDALTSGQFKHARGIEYGGKAPEWSHLVLQKIIKTFCKSVRHVAYIDWHTLVETRDGEFLFLCFNQPGDHLYRRVGSWWGHSAVDRASVNQRFENSTANVKRPSRHGLLMWGLQNHFAPHADLAGAVVEFCAKPDSSRENRTDLQVLNETVKEHLETLWIYDHLGDTGRFAQNIRKRHVENAVPSRNDWRESAIEIALELYKQTIQGANSWAAENLPASPGRLVHYAKFE